MNNFRACVEYDGTKYYGWQRQKGQISVQGVIEKKLSEFLGEKVVILGSGRTDTGVHAYNQYFTFRTKRDLPERAYVKGFNRMLPPDIRIKAVVPVPREFHPIFDAKRKTYEYKILNREVPPALDRDRVWFLPYRLNVSRMNKAAAMIIGKHDFSSFRAALCSRKDPVRIVYEAFWKRKGDLVIFTITANGFLHHMVRILVGTMTEVGQGRMTLDEFSTVVKACDRKKASVTAPPQGLYLCDVRY